MTLLTFQQQHAGSGWPSSSSPSPGKSDSGPVAKLVTFSIGRLTLALPMVSISRVINMPEVFSSGLSAVGVATLNRLQLTIIDLHHQLFKQPAPNSGEQRGYLIILPSPADHPIGIPTLATPTLVDVPERDIRILPAAYRQADTLSIASHIARITTESGGKQSIFLLDVAAVLEQIQRSGLALQGKRGPAS